MTSTKMDHQSYGIKFLVLLAILLIEGKFSIFYEKKMLKCLLLCRKNMSTSYQWAYLFNMNIYLLMNILDLCV